MHIYYVLVKCNPNSLTSNSSCFPSPQLSTPNFMYSYFFFYCTKSAVCFYMCMGVGRSAGACIGIWSYIPEENRPTPSSCPLFIAPQWGARFVHPSLTPCWGFAWLDFWACNHSYCWVCVCNDPVISNKCCLTPDIHCLQFWYFHHFSSSELWAWSGELVEDAWLGLTLQSVWLSRFEMSWESPKWQETTGEKTKSL